MSPRSPFLSLHAIGLALLVTSMSACSSAGSATQRSETSRQRPASSPSQPGEKQPFPCGASSKAPKWRHVVWIVMENKAYDQIIGSPDAPYENHLAAHCGLATNYHAVTHPSLPNYIAMTSGGTQGIADDDPPEAHPLSVPSIFSQLGSDWTSLEESMPSKCDLATSGEYAVKHNPAAYFTGIRSACAAHDIPLTSSPDLSASFTFITPNICHDMHDCPVATGDGWLAGFLPSVIGSSQYRQGNTAVFITYDEDDGSGDNHVATIVIGLTVPQGARSSRLFTHYSLLRTTEEMLGLRLLGAAADAPSMRRPFRL